MWADARLNSWLLAEHMTTAGAGTTRQSVLAWIAWIRDTCYIFILMWSSRFVEHNWIISFFLGYGNLLQTIKLPHHEVKQHMDQIQQKIDALPTSGKPLPPVMQPSAFLTALADLNTANPDILQDFLVATQARSSANLPKPVPMTVYNISSKFLTRLFIKIPAPLRSRQPKPMKFSTGSLPMRRKAF